MRHTLFVAAFALSLTALPGLISAAPLPPQVDQVREKLRHGNLDDAIEAADDATEQLSSDALAWMWAGRVYGRQAMEANLLTKAKWAGRSRDAFEKAVELQPNLIEARFDLMQYYLLAPGFMGGGRDKAEQQAAAIAALDDAEGKVAAGHLAAQDKDEKNAESLYRQALAVNGASVRALFALNAFLQNRKRFDEVQALWTAALEKEKVRALAQYQLGRLAAISGEQLELGLKYLDAFIASGKEPEQLTVAAAQWRRGQLLDKLGRQQEAIAALQLALGDRDVGELAKSDLERLRKSSAKG